MVRRAARGFLWVCFVPLLRRRAYRRLPGLRAGEVTIVTVTWNSTDYLLVLLRLVRRWTTGNFGITVVDNASDDDLAETLRSQPRVRLVRFPFNVGHDLALDTGFLLAETEYVVALDVDAFPLRGDWLETLLAPLSAGYEISGARLNREYVHPCCLAMRTARFVERKHSFRSHYLPAAEGRTASGDIGEEMSAREAGRLTFFDPTSQRGPGDVGTVFGDIVYHNFYSTRFRTAPRGILDGVVGRDDPPQAWGEALDLYDR
jgi:glycosyltransferase involved in cell wall biosynthesis